MAICSVLLGFLKQALENCHVFIFHNTLTSTPSWLTHTESQKPWMVVYSHQLDDLARGSQQGRKLGNLEKVRHVVLSANKAASTCTLLSCFKENSELTVKLNSACHLCLSPFMFKWERKDQIWWSEKHKYSGGLSFRRACNPVSSS